MTRYDKVLMAGILAISVLSYLAFYWLNQADAPLLAEISVNGTIVSQVNLNDPASEHLINISGPLGNSVAEVKPGAIRMKSSPCPDHYCMKSSWISRPGQVIACVPNRIIIKIAPHKNSKNSVDSISH